MTLQDLYHQARDQSLGISSVLRSLQKELGLGDPDIPF
jgi:hypothetical protein